MGKDDFDNVLKVFKTGISMNGATLVSIEGDLELPRGFLAKIHKAELRIDNLNRDFAGISVDKNAEIELVLILDPDDTATDDIPFDRVDHDVLMDHEVAVEIVAGAAGDPGKNISQVRKLIDFASNPKLDVITVRNFRLNAVAVGADAADVTDSIAVAEIYYTLEKVTVDFVLDLLGIL